MLNIIIMLTLLPFAAALLAFIVGLSIFIVTIIGLSQLILLPSKILWHIREYDLEKQRELLDPKNHKEPK